MSREMDHTKTLVFMALMIALSMVGTYMIRFPVVATQGYIHIGDSVLILAILVLGWKKGAAAGGIGEALSDLLAGYAAFAPITLVVKILMGMVIGLAFEIYFKNKEEHSRIRRLFLPAVVYLCAGAVMLVGYYLAEAVMYGSFVVPVAEVPMNVIQFVGGSVIAFAAATLLYKSPVKRRFYYS